ncbi:unnamed protein product [Arabidopsis lyrata]|nr:unnamed protein product [Arabidopsis lyrata]
MEHFRKPPANDQTSTMWSCCNSMVMSWITSSVSEDIRNTIMYHKTTQAMWSALKDRYTCGAKEAWEKYEEEECLTQFLIGVNQSHRQTIDMILTKEPLPDVYWALKRLEFEESQRPIGSRLYKNRTSIYPRPHPY